MKKILAVSWAVLALLPSFHNAEAGNGASRTTDVGRVTKIPLLVMPIEYSDCKLTFADEAWNKKIFSTPTREEEDQRFDLFGFCGTSVNNYFEEITCGRFQFAPLEETCGTVNDGVIRVGLDVQHPHEDSGAMARAVHLAISKAAPYMNLSDCDRNKDKVLSPKELVIVVVSAGGTADSTYSRNRTFYSRLNANARSIPGFVVVSERRDDLRSTYARLAQSAGVEPRYKNFPVSIGTLIHELGHVFGTPDLPFTGYLTAVGYGQKNGSTALFPRTTLEYTRSAPSHYGAYTMVEAGFVDPIVLERTGIYEVNSAGTGRYNVYKIPTSDPKEYFLIENRQREGSDLAVGVTDKTGATGGIAIWHVNETFGRNNDKARQMVAIKEASEGNPGRSPAKGNRNFPALDSFYHKPGNVEFSSTSTPNNRSHGGVPQPWIITDVSASGSVMSFKFTCPKTEDR